MAKTITVRGEPILLDQLLAAEYGPVIGRMLVPAALSLNPGLASAGAIVPVGTAVIMPDRPTGTRAATRPTISLFG